MDQLADKVWVSPKASLIDVRLVLNVVGNGHAENQKSAA